MTRPVGMPPIAPGTVLIEPGWTDKIMRARLDWTPAATLAAIFERMMECAV